MSDTVEANRDHLSGVIERAEKADATAQRELSETLYSELHIIATNMMRNERPGVSLQTTMLVHDAYLKLIGQRELDFRQRSTVLAAAANTMRRLLVDHARKRNRIKRGGGKKKFPLRVSITDDARPFDILELDESLAKLEAISPQAAAVVEMKFFVGMTHEEIAKHLDCSSRTIDHKWSFAKAWLYREMANE